MTINISVISIVVTVVLFLLVHVGTLVWFMSRINIVVMILQRDLTALGEILKKFESERYTVRDADKDWAHHKDEHKTLWQKYDRVEERVGKLEQGGPK